MLGIRAAKEAGEKLRLFAKQQKLLRQDYKIFTRGKFIYIPISEPSQEQKERLEALGARLVNKRFKRQKAERGKSIRQLLKLEGEPLAYDVLGNIAVINETKNAREIAEAIMKANKRVKTVVMKKGAVSGEYRTRAYRHILGDKNFIARYRENGCTFVFDIRKVFFSPRLAYERKRIVEQVKPNENVLVMFAGVGPFAIEIAKHKPANVAAIELNDYAYKSMLENIRLNNVNVRAVKGDVKEKAKEFKNWADRIVMPLPKDSYSFLDSSFIASKQKGIIHYYAFGPIDKAIDEHKAKIAKFFARKGAKVNFLFARVVRPYSPSEVEVVIDFALLKPKSK